MSAINYGSMQTLVYRNCGNMQSSHPFYGNVPDNVNDAANHVLRAAYAMDRRALNNFPELQNRRWWALTDANANTFDVPTNCLIVDSLTHTRVATDYDPDADQEYPIVEQPDAVIFGQLDKTATGWPSQWRRDGAQIYYWPTTDTSPTDYSTVVILRGFRSEDTLSNSQDTFVMHERWHPTIVRAATAITMEQMEWHDSAEKWWAMVRRDLTAIINPSGMEKKRDRTVIKVAGAVR